MATSPGSRKPPESLTATLRLSGQEFSFRLFNRPLRLGSYGTVQYYWMDSSQFRDINSEASAANFRNCIGHWVAAMQASGCWDEVDQQIHFVCAMCFALVGRSKGMQDVYHDAYLASTSCNPERMSLPDEVRQRINDLVRDQNRFEVQRELDQALGRFEVPPRVMPALQEAFRWWVGRGVVALRRHGDTGFDRFLQEIDYWLAKLRKRSDRWVRHFLNLFAYEAKVSFYTCYANVWVDLIPWLQKHRNLDELSTRFLGLWHNQNQPIELPHGRTLGGLYYPTAGRVTVVEPNRNGRPVPRSLRWRTEQIGPTHVRDVLSGQVLSLHALSGFFMKDPALCALAGRFFTCDRYEEEMRRARAENCPEYWAFVGAIVTAAHLYRAAREEQERCRGVFVRDGETVAGATEQAQDYGNAALLEEFAAAHQICCPSCGGAVRFRRFWPANAKGCVRAKYSCRRCRKSFIKTLDGESLATWLIRGSEPADCSA